MFGVCLEAYTEMLGEEHSSTINCLSNLAAVERDLRNFTEAIRLFERAVALRKEHQGEDSKDYYLTLSMAAGAYRENGNPEKALKYLREAYVGVAQISEGNEETTSSAILLNAMGLTYKKLKNYERAEDSYKRALEIREGILGESHPDAIATRHSLAELYLEWGIKQGQAKELLDINVELSSNRLVLLEEHLEKRSRDDPSLRAMSSDQKKKLAQQIYDMEQAKA